MHSCIYQIERFPVKDDERIRESYFYGNLGAIPADYVRNMDNEEEEEWIKELPKILPSEMFQCDGRVIEFLGGDETFFVNWQTDVKDALLSFAPETIAEGNTTWKYLYDLQEAVENALCTDYWFCYDGQVMKSTEFIMNMMRLNKGHKLFVGSVLDYCY